MSGQVSNEEQSSVITITRWHMTLSSVTWWHSCTQILGYQQRHQERAGSKTKTKKMLYLPYAICMPHQGAINLRVHAQLHQ